MTPLRFSIASRPVLRRLLLVCLLSAGAAVPASDAPEGEEAPVVLDAELLEEALRSIAELPVAPEIYGPPLPAEMRDPDDLLPERALVREADTAPLPPAPHPGVRSLELSLRRAAEIAFQQHVELPATPPIPRERAPGRSDARTVLQSMAQSQDPSVRRRALESWHDLSDPLAQEALLNAMMDPDAGVRATALERMAESGVPELHQAIRVRLTNMPQQLLHELCPLLPALSAALGPDNLQTLQNVQASSLERQYAAYLLGCMRHAEAAGTLARLAWDPDAGLARMAAQSLFELQHAHTVRDWYAFASHSDPFVAALAVDATARAGGQEALHALRDIAAGQARASETVQMRAIQALLHWPQNAGIPPLIQAMRRNPRLAPAIGRMLDNKTGLGFGSNTVAWEEWLQEMTTGGAGASSPLVPAQ